MRGQPAEDDSYRNLPSTSVSRPLCSEVILGNKSAGQLLTYKGAAKLAKTFSLSKLRGLQPGLNMAK